MKEKIKSDLIIEIEKKIDSILKKENYILIDIEITGGKNKNLTIYVYNKNKIDVEKLGKINNILYPVIENISFFKDGFTLEISSPGLYRKMKYVLELNIFIGREIKITTINGEIINGISNGLKNNVFSIINKNEEIVKINLQDIKTAKLDG